MDPFWLFIVIPIMFMFFVDLIATSESDRKPIIYCLLVGSFVFIGKSISFLFNKGHQTFVNTSKKALTIPTETNNPQLAFELNHYKDFIAKHSLCDSSSIAFLDMQEARIRSLQELDIQEKRQTDEVDIKNYKMVKSLENFNLCSQLLLSNPVLMDMVKKADETRGMQILAGVMGLSSEQANANRKMLLQVVQMVKNHRTRA